MNVPLSQITTTLSVFMGSEYINDFDYNNRTYRVFVQADQPFRMSASDLHSYYVRSDSGQMVPLDNLVTVAESSGPPVITHYNLFRAVEIDGSPAPGYSSGQGLAAMEDLANKSMMPGMSYRVDRPDARRDRVQRQSAASSSAWEFWSSISRSRRSTRASRCPSSSCSLYPWRCWALWAWSRCAAMSNDVYCQIGLVMLIGLSAKNAILIVEFAEQLRRKGRSIAEAAIEAGELRLRPILMTSFAFILGVLPLVFATGAGALGRRSVGTTIVGGMLLSTVLNLFFIPVLYVIVSRLLKRVKSSSQEPHEA